MYTQLLHDGCHLPYGVVIRIDVDHPSPRKVIIQLNYVYTHIKNWKTNPFEGLSTGEEYHFPVSFGLANEVHMVFGGEDIYPTATDRLGQAEEHQVETDGHLRWFSGRGGIAEQADIFTPPHRVHLLLDLLILGRFRHISHGFLDKFFEIQAFLPEIGFKGLSPGMG